MSVRDELFAEPYRFDFFQAVRLLRRIFRERAAVGSARPGAEVVHFKAHQSLVFPASQIFDLFPPEDEEHPARMVVTFMGLTGPTGVLPSHYTELMIKLDWDERGPERTALRDWFDLFNHRMISLFYRAWEKYRFYIPYERGEGVSGELEPFSRAVLSTFGLGTPSLRDRLTVQDSSERPLARIEDLSLAYYAGLLSQRPANPTNLRNILEDYFQVPVSVKQFHGRWLAIEPSLQTRIGEWGTLGADAMAGSKIWDVQSQFRLRIGPLSYKRFTELLPDHAPDPVRKDFFLLVRLTRLFVGPELEFDVQLILKAEEAPDCRLSDEGLGARLGWNTWLITRTPEKDLDDPVFPAEVVSTVI